MKKTILIGLVVLLSAVSVRADYIGELWAGYSEFDYEDLDQRSDGYSVGGNIYFDKVDTSKGPLSLAAFLNKASGVYAGFDNFESSESRTLGISYVNSHDYVFGAFYGEEDSDYFYSLVLGKYLTDTGRLLVFYSDEEDLDKKSVDVSYLGVSDVGASASLAYGATASYSEDVNGADQDIFGVFGYFPTPALGLTVIAGFGSDDNGFFADDDDEYSFFYGLEAEYFVLERFAGSLGVLRFDFDSIGVVDSIEAEITLRF